MSLVWIPLTGLAAFLYGIGQVFTKTGTSRIGPPRMLLLLSVNMLIVYGGAFLSFFLRSPISLSFDTLFPCFVASLLSALGYIFFYEAVERQKISIVGVITSAYPFVTMVTAVLFLHERLSVPQVPAIAFVILSVSLLSYAPQAQNRRKRTWLIFAVLCFVTWGVWSVVAKYAMTGTGYLTYAGVCAVTSPLVWVPYSYLRTRSLHLVHDFQAELSLLFFCVGGLCFYAAINFGPVSIVTALSGMYPFVTLVSARLLLQEELEIHHALAVALALTGILLLSFW